MLQRTSSNKEHIFRTLLNHPEGNLTKYRLAKLSQCTYSSAHRILRELEVEDLVIGTKVKNFSKMIEIWREWKIRRDSREYLIKDPLEILRKTNLQYALTTYQAENLVQNYLIPSRIDFYVEQKDKLRWHETLIKNDALVGRGNVKIIMGDKHIFYNALKIHGYYVVSIPQLIVDLLKEGGVCVEAAQNLLEKVK